MADTRRLFFALWPPAPVQTALADLAREAGVGGRPVAPVRLHMTLAFLGDLDESAVEPLCAAAGRIRGTAFVLEMARLGHFYRTGVAWVGPESTPTALADLAADVQKAAASAGIRLRSRRFRPHVTLARRAERPSSWHVDRPICWTVRGFSLTESVRGEGKAVYRGVARWPLAADVGGAFCME